MEKFKKLGRDEMKKVLGGLADSCPSDECGPSKPCNGQATCTTSACDASGSGTSYKVCIPF